MKTTKLTYCVANGENLQEFAQQLSKISLQGRTLIAKFEGKLLHISPHSTPRDIINSFEYLEYNAASMTLISNL